MGHDAQANCVQYVKGSQLLVTAAKGGICTEIEKGHTEIPGGVE